MCGSEIMSINHQTTGYLNWHIADTGNGKCVRMCCSGDVAWIENVFCKHGIQLGLVFKVLVTTTCFAGACISGVSL